MSMSLTPLLPPYAGNVRDRKVWKVPELIHRLIELLSTNGYWNRLPDPPAIVVAKSPNMNDFACCAVTETLELYKDHLRTTRDLFFNTASDLKDFTVPGKLRQHLSPIVEDRAKKRYIVNRRDEFWPVFTECLRLWLLKNGTKLGLSPSDMSQLGDTSPTNPPRLLDSSAGDFDA